MKIERMTADLHAKVEQITISADTLLNPQRKPGEEPDIGFVMIFFDKTSPDRCGATSNGLTLAESVYLMQGLIEGVEAGQVAEKETGRH